MRTIAALLLAFIAIAHAQSPSFNCANARSVREKTVCATPDLASLDAKIARAYSSTRAALSPASATLIQQDQRDWLSWLDKVCPAGNPHINGPAICLTNHYNTRLDQLTKGTLRTKDLVIFTRAHFVVVPGKATDNHVPNDPGFGYGSFAWPQIDNPTPQQQAFNDAVFSTALKYSCCIVESKPIHTLDDAVDSDGWVDGFYSIHAANSHFISVDIGNSTYGWGAAHPNTSITHFNWWLSQQRELKPEDVFAPNSSWQRELVAPTVAHLSPYVAEYDSGSTMSGWNAEGVAKSVAAELADPASWSVSSRGLIINFGQYEIGPYALGMPTAELTWKELQPYLNPKLRPDTLPRPQPTQ